MAILLKTPLGKALCGLALACVAALTGACGSAAPSSTAPATSGRATQTITVTMTEFAFALDHPPNGPGAYVFHAVNAGKYPHAVALEGVGVSDQKSSIVQPGASTDLAATLQAGDLDMYCPVAGHRAKGMETHLTLGAAGAGTRGY
jgi:plastocyanin